MTQKTIIKKSHKVKERPPFESIALLLQGGGALGAYQGGVYEALIEAGIEPDWVAGISIGAFNSAIIAGNKREDRVPKLRAFWEYITNNNILDSMAECEARFVQGDTSRSFMNQTAAAMSLMTGIHGFFSPRFPMPWLAESGTVAATSYYDTTPLHETLMQFVDFDLINKGDTHLSVGAVNVRTGNFAYFDTDTDVIGPEHIMASGALPPGFPPVLIDGEHYWDGGLVSNTPLDWVLDSTPRKDMLAFQVDLWSAQGDMPRNMAEVGTRQKEILYSSRTRTSTDRFKKAQKMRHAFSKLYAKLPEELKKSHEAKVLSAKADYKVYNIVHLICRASAYEGDSKDYEFSRLSMNEHWKMGYNDTVRTLRHKEVLERPKNDEGVFIFDINHADK